MSGTLIFQILKLDFYFFETLASMKKILSDQALWCCNLLLSNFLWSVYLGKLTLLFYTIDFFQSKPHQDFLL